MVQIETGKGNRSIEAAEEGIIINILFEEGARLPQIKSYLK